MTGSLLRVGGSFRDPSSCVYEVDGRILRGVDKQSLENFRALEAAEFYRQAVAGYRIVETKIVTDSAAAAVAAHGWAGVLEHQKLALISYPYEWTFSMLKDAALLHLGLLEESIKSGWTIKDSSPFNIQYVGSAPIFIDVPSFLPRTEGDHWAGYRQFCMLFLYPLLLKTHLGIDFNNILRSSLDGLSPQEAARFIAGLKYFKKGVLSHIVFPAVMEKRAERKQWSGTLYSRGIIKQSDIAVLGLVQSMRRLIESLSVPIVQRGWSEYATTHSYDEAAFEEKQRFVTSAVETSKWHIVWDVGCNTGTFSQICAAASDHVVAVDADHDAVEKLYVAERSRGGTQILPLCVNLANISPSQGWGGVERLAFDRRNKPQLVLCLALIHHMSLSANIPIPLFLDWLRSLCSSILIEFVDRDDVMVRKLLANKAESYAEYNREVFERELQKRFRVLKSHNVKGGSRQLHFCEPLGQ